MDDFEQFYNDVEQLIYKHKFSRRGNKDLIDVVEDIFSKCNDFEIELDETRDDLTNKEEELQDLREEFDSLETNLNSLLSEKEDLEEKVEIYRQALVDNNLVEYLI
jgi:chromosome segregation ATPase